MARFSLQAFEIANPLYAGATLTLYTVSDAGVATTTLATVYEAPTGPALLANPQTLDGEGKLERPIYVDQPVIARVSGTVSSHDTGIQSEVIRNRGTWATGVVYGPGDLVTDGPNGANTLGVYIVESRHTSGIWADDLLAGRLSLLMSAVVSQAPDTTVSDARLLAAWYGRHVPLQNFTI